MTFKQQCQTIGLNLKRIAHILIINGSIQKKDYFINETKSILEEISHRQVPEKFNKILNLFKIDEVLNYPHLSQADAFLTWGSIMSLRAASL